VISPLAGTRFGSYQPDEVRWLLTDLSDYELEADTAQREQLIQSGAAHYAESLPIEYQPGPEYRALFGSVLKETANRLATAVGAVTELVLAQRQSDIVLVSLARAGTPIGILMRRWAHTRHGLTLPHYAVSIVRDRGIDTAALDFLAARHDSSKVVFVDGWTGKGAIISELSAALAGYRRSTGIHFNDDLAVLADPGHCARTFGTRDDFLIASACLNSTVSGLVSRTVLNPRILAPGQFHGAKFYRDLAADDVSNYFLDTVSARFSDVRSDVEKRLVGLLSTDRTPTWSGMTTVRRLGEQYGVSNPNFVKPGIGETTRVLLRRVPWRILVRDKTDPEHRHIRMLAASRDVPVTVDQDLAYSCVGLIKDLNA
jgi:hypothetical protein